MLADLANALKQNKKDPQQEQQHTDRKRDKTNPIWR